MDEAAQNAVLEYWFETLTPGDWFSSNAKIDAAITKRFGLIYEAAICEAQGADLPGHAATPAGSLVRIIVLDQFPRNMFRGTAKAFASDTLALAISKAGIAVGQDAALTLAQKAFFYMPFMHSENVEDQARSLILFGAAGLEGNYDFAVQHKAIIDRFGRYPHRNAVLRRQSTKAELVFLKEHGSSF